MTATERFIVLGTDDAGDLMRRAAASYAVSLRPSSSGNRGIRAQGVTRPESLIDELYDGLHVVRFISAPDGRTILHTHDCDQVIIVTRGDPYIEEGAGAKHRLAPGDVVLVRSGIPHLHGSEVEGAETIVLTKTGHSTDAV